MALVSGFEKKELAHAAQQKKTDASYSVFELNGETYFQVDTYGSSDRQLVGKRSRSVRLNRDAAQTLIALLQKEFSL